MAPATRRTPGIDTRAFPYDSHGTEKPHYRTRAGLAPSVKHRDKGSKGNEQGQARYLTAEGADNTATARRKKAFRAYTFRLKPPTPGLTADPRPMTPNTAISPDRPNSAPANLKEITYVTDLGGTLTQPRNKQRGLVQDKVESPRPKMRPNSANFLFPLSTSPPDLDVFPPPRSTDQRGEWHRVSSNRSRQHPVPPTEKPALLTPHEKMFYTHHLSRLPAAQRDRERYQLPDSYNQDVLRCDHLSSTLHAPSNEAVTEYRLGREEKPPATRVVQHQHRQALRGDRQRGGSRRSTSRNALGGFYS